MRFSQYKGVLELIDSVIEATEYMKAHNSGELCALCAQSLHSVLDTIKDERNCDEVIAKINNAVECYDNDIYDAEDLFSLITEIKRNLEALMYQYILNYKNSLSGNGNTDFDIEQFYNELIEYEAENDEDSFGAFCNEKNYDVLSELKKVLSSKKINNENYELLYKIAVLLEKYGDLAFASAYYAKAAIEMKKQNQLKDYSNIVSSFNTAPKACREIFETLLKSPECTIVFLSICGFGKERQRYQNLALAFAQVGVKVIYITPESYATVNNSITEDELADYVIRHSEFFEGVEIVTPLCAENYGIHSYNKVIEKISSSEKNPIFLVSNVGEWKSIIPQKGKNKIIFDCADDNSDYKNAFWSNPQLYENEKLLVKFSDAVLCTAYSLFLKKSIFENIPNVYLSHNAVSALEMKRTGEFSEPEDLSAIPHPRIGYIGCIYQRFDRDLFYELVRNNPDKSFVIVGSIINNHIKMIYPNMYYLGSKAHSELFKYYSGMDICIIPYFDNAKMSMSCDPVKIHEHISCGVPTITTYMPDTGIDRLMTYHANTSDEFQKCIDEILNNKPSINCETLNSYLAENSWISRACQIIRVACDETYEYEKTDNCIAEIKQKFESVKDKHPNFGVIYGIASLKDNINESEKYISKAKNDYDTDFNTEIMEKLQELSLSRSLKNNISVVSREKCVGCFSCINTCSLGAINLIKDDLGFSYPKVENNMCVSCGKCTEHCPALNIIPVGTRSSVCYAVTASEQKRLYSSSGAVFPVLAETFIKNGGYVAGAVFDENYKVKHILTNNLHELSKMYESKYMESNLGDIYKQIKLTLKSGNKVLFSGCPCQVAGLYSFLGQKYDTLTTISVVCHGVPSAELFSQHLSEICNDNDKIHNISFRNKRVLGWNSGLCVENDIGNYAKNSAEDNYMIGFLNDLYLRESCYNCRYKTDIISDIVLGDFWGIKRIEKNIDDNFGVSYVSINSSAGSELFKENSTMFQMISTERKDYAELLNPSMIKSAKKPDYHYRFIDNIKNYKFDAAFEKTFNDVSFDAVLVLWYSNNYGNALTNFALYKTVESLGYNVLAVDNLVIRPDNQFKSFAKRHFNLSSSYFPETRLDYLVNCSENFIVGSDQVWNLEFSQAVGHSGYFQLKFIPCEKNKISYGSSFGQTSKAVEPERKEFYKKLYKRFDHISTREKFGVKVLREVFSVKGEYVLDPVFVVDKKEYMELSEKANIKSGSKFIIAYILTPSEEKVNYTKKLAEKMGDDVEIIYIIDAEPVRYNQNKKYFCKGENVKFNISPEEVLYYFMNSEFVITDSYHGTCFSIIFEKRFISFINRESERFETFKEWNLDKRINAIIPETIDPSVFDEINYEMVNAKLNRMREKSIDYLKKALNS